MRHGREKWRRLALMLLPLCGGGCVERLLTVQSDPPGALVYLNDQEFGRTPLTHRFIWYGYYEVQVRKEGYQTLNVVSPVIAPWWQWVPFDLVAEVLPAHLEDHEHLSYRLKPLSEAQVDPERILERGEQSRQRLEPSRVPRPQTRATTRPAGK